MTDKAKRPHGTLAHCFSGGCRCLHCWTALRRYRTRGLAENDPRHGTPNGYKNCGCRCDACRAANAAEQRKFQAGKRANAAAARRTDLRSGGAA
jgi:hypothetical protein